MCTLKYENVIFFPPSPFFLFYKCILFQSLIFWGTFFKLFFCALCFSKCLCGTTLTHTQTYIHTDTHTDTHTWSSKHPMKQRWDHLIKQFNGVVPENIINNLKAPPQTSPDLERNYLRDNTQRFSIWGYFIPTKPHPLDDIWQCLEKFLVVKTGGKCYCHLVSRDQGC